MPRLTRILLAAVLGVICWSASGSEANAQTPLPKYYYYPYHYYPHNYWPTQWPQWPEPKGAPYMAPPPYMAYPPFLEKGWRYDMFAPKPYYRGFHFWLDQF